jgi:hypothetical protein
MDILNISIIILLNSSQNDLLVEPKIISSTYIWHINKSFPIFSNEESRVGITNPKTIFNKKISKTFIPYSWCLLKLIECLIEFIDMVRIFFIFKAG